MRLRIGLDPLAVSADDVDKLAREWEALADMQEINARRAIGIDALMFRIGVLGR